MVPQQKHSSRLFWVFSCNACVQAGFLVPSLKFGRESAGSEALDFFFGIRAVLILSR